MDIHEAIEKGILIREPARPGELQQLLAGLTRRLSDARRPQNYPDTQADQTYLAIIKCAIIALRTEGLRAPSPDVAHEEVLDTLAETLRVDPQRIETYKKLHELREKAIWEGALPSLRSVAEAVEEAVWLSERLQRWLEDQDRVAPKDPPASVRQSRS